MESAPVQPAASADGRLRLPKWLYVTAGLSLPAGIFCIGSLLAPEVLGINLTPLTFFLGLLLDPFSCFLQCLYSLPAS